MIKKENLPSDILKDLEEVYTLAMEKGNLTAALRAKELLGKACGLFTPSKKKSFSLADLSEKDLEGLIQEIQGEISEEREITQ